MNNVFNNEELAKKTVRQLVSDYRRIDRFIEETESSGVYLSADIIGAMNAAKDLLITLFRSEEDKDKDYQDTEVFKILEASYLNDDEITYELFHNTK